MSTIMNCWNRFAATVESRADHIALVQGEHQITFQELGTRVRALSEVLGNLDVQPGDRCIAWGDNSIDFAVIPPAIWALGAVPVPLGGAITRQHLNYVCGMTNASCVISSGPPDAYQPSDLDCPIFDCCGINLVKSNDSLLPCPGHFTEPDQPASMILTSGSTGTPKGVIQTHETLIQRCEAVAASLGYRDEDRLLCPVPWSHDYGWGQLLSVYFLGTQMALPEMPGPVGVSSAIGRNKPTIIGGVPSLYAAFVRSPTPIREVDRSSVRLLTSTGSAFPQTILNDTRALFEGAGIALNYGLTETYRSTCLKPEDLDAKPGSVGRAIEGVRISILRDDGHDAVPGQVGEVVHHGAGVFAGYWRDKERTDSVRQRSCLFPADEAIYQVKTGDYGWLDEQGYLYLEGRRDRFIKTMDVRVGLDEIEAGLLMCADLMEVAVIDIPHEIMGTMIVAAIVYKPGVEPDDRAVKNHVRSQLAPAMRPRIYHKLDAIPRTSSGKIDYSTLRKLITPI
jgi:acyl-CoA synthetase (AMP-forming)/AMP-acid ligase II